MNLAKPTWGWRGSVEVGLCTLLLNVVLSLLITFALSLMPGLTGSQFLGSPMGTAFLGASEVLLGIPLLIYSRKHKIDRSHLGIRIGDRYQTLTDVLSGAIVGLSMVPVSIVVSALNGLVLGPQPNTDYLRSAFAVTSPLEAVLLLSAIVFVVAPVEEIIARGFIQSGFEESFGRHKGLVLASLFFSVMHLSLWSVFPLFALGIILGSVFLLRHGRILAPITSHATYMVCVVAFASI